MNHEHRSKKCRSERDDGGLNACFGQTLVTGISIYILQVSWNLHLLFEQERHTKQGLRFNNQVEDKDNDNRNVMPNYELTVKLAMFNTTCGFCLALHFKTQLFLCGALFDSCSCVLWEDSMKNCQQIMRSWEEMAKKQTKLQIFSKFKFLFLTKL